MIISRILPMFLLAALASGLRAQTPAPDYGAPIPLAEAKRALAAAQVEAVKNKWNVKNSQRTKFSLI